MESLLVWGLALVAASLVLILVEIFVPSAGLISLLSAACGVGGLVCLFMHDWRWGLGAFLAMMVLLPMAVAFGFHVFPSTPLGRIMMLENPDRAGEAASDTDAVSFANLLNQEGQVLTDLRPVGVVRIAEQRVDALSEIGLIRAGTTVRVTSVEGRQIKVRPVET